MSRGTVLAGLVVAFGCAKQELPPGTGPDRMPPAVEETWPAYGETVSDLDGDAWIRFDEPLSDPRIVERNLVASPAGRYRVTPGRRRIRIRPEAGWQEGVVYYFAIPGGLTDLVRNRTASAIELLFSTGDSVPPTLAEGRAYDRVTGRGTRGARLLFLSPDSIPYTAVSDTGGVFRLPGLPYGSYDANVFIDQNRNLAYDPEFEPGTVVEIEVSEETPTLAFDAWMLPADSTPPILLSAEVLDSLTLRLTFDDPLDANASLDDAAVVVEADEGGTWSAVAIVVGRPSAPANDDVEEDPGPVPARPTPASAFITATLDRVLAAGSYRVSAVGIPNLRGLSASGDTTFVYEPPPLPESEPEEGEP